MLYQLSHFRLIVGAENGIRTRDPQLGKLLLYQLSYFRSLGRLVFLAGP
jgi:hypothetical protein